MGCRTIRGKVHDVTFGFLLRRQGHGAYRRGDGRQSRACCACQASGRASGPCACTHRGQHRLPAAAGTGCAAPSGRQRPQSSPPWQPEAGRRGPGGIAAQAEQGPPAGRSGLTSPIGRDQRSRQPGSALAAPGTGAALAAGHLIAGWGRRRCRMPGGVAEDNPAQGGIHVGRLGRGSGDPGQAVVGAQGGQGLGHAEDAAEVVDGDDDGIPDGLRAGSGSSGRGWPGSPARRRRCRPR